MQQTKEGGMTGIPGFDRYPSIIIVLYRPLLSHGVRRPPSHSPTSEGPLCAPSNVSFCHGVTGAEKQTRCAATISIQTKMTPGWSTHNAALSPVDSTPGGVLSCSCSGCPATPAAPPRGDAGICGCRCKHDLQFGRRPNWKSTGVVHWSKL